MTRFGVKASHRQLAQVLWEAGMLTFEELSEILTQLGARAVEETDIPIQEWVSEGWISDEQLRQGIDLLRERFDDLEEAGLLKVDEFVRAETALFEGSDRGAIDSQSTFDEIELDKLGLELDTDLVSEGEAAFDESGKEGVKTAVFERGQVAVESSSISEERLGTIVTSDFSLAFDKTGLFTPSVTPDDLMSGRDRRYELGAELGRGGGGRVVDALDRLLGRHVAMKIYEPSSGDKVAGKLRFLAEAQATSQLEHPNIMPIYDMGLRDDGSVYYTMLRVKQHSLEEVLDGLAARDANYVEEYSLTRLVSILKQVSQAMHYAHQKGVIHRDLKPGNIMLGNFGEVWVMDWGLAHVLGVDVRTELSRQQEGSQEAGYTLGTPSYMSPEQAQGRLQEVDERSDIYGLGAILYQMLSLSPPFDKDHPIETMWSVVESALIPPSRRADDPLWAVPEELERISLKAMSKKRQDRHQSGREFFDELEAYAAGLGSRNAQTRLENARQSIELFREKKRRVAALDETMQAIRDEIDAWEPIDQKRKLWALQDEKRSLRVDWARHFGEALANFQQALANDPQSEVARRELVDLYWERFCEAEGENNSFEESYFRALLEKAGDSRYLARLEATARLQITTQPPGATVTLFPYEELDRRLVVANAKPIGETPAVDEELAQGSYLAVLQAVDRAVVRAPVLVNRGEDIEMTVVLPKSQDLSSDYVFIAGGPCQVGGDPEAENPRRLSTVQVKSFFCARYPVTVGEYLDFLDDLEPDEARGHVPRTQEGNEFLMCRDEIEETWRPASQMVKALEVTGLLEAELSRLPVVGITIEDARAYCAWSSERDGRAYRLPRPEEWEKAGRGVDGRYFPWGDHFDATFCKMRHSREDGRRSLEAVGTFVDDVSPHGVRDLSGGVQEWCESVDGKDLYPVRGGAWNRDERLCRLASIRKRPAQYRALNLGMRLVYDFDGD